MAGADVFTMEPEEVHQSVAILFDVESEVDAQTVTLIDGTAELAQQLKDAGTALGPALAEAAEWWRLSRAGGFSRLCGTTGEYLAVCAEEAVEVDEYNAGDFASLAGHDRYPGRAGEHASARPDF
ncbi:hypothetical protein K3N28_16250 [Glycomyces sp. TRM65418]|uniref:hypothetical protein n=1 Tax=Glycomyces sp. TRM65418 TaxID=2867006 RepID=UPI001CE5863B|nr:hypothetical protein [Glycomyces sp. TRM65418]MCC3764611.1 hypothetical protein [Glycomyces sp. TRM65418]QZD54275.1 hypothetical protein K3N28_16165 [Glycomyces sp. TRM65418]